MINTSLFNPLDKNNQWLDSFKKINSKGTERPIPIFDFAIQNENDSEIFTKANRIIHIFQKALSLLISDQQMDFKIAQQLKETKKDAKILFQNKTISPDTKQALEKVVQYYDYIVERVEVLSILREISQQIRKVNLKQKDLDESPLFNRFLELLTFIERHSKKDYLLNGSLIFMELVTAYQTNQSLWKHKWNAIRKTIWNAASESQSFLQKGQKITFITGSNSSSIPSILKIKEFAPNLSTKPALIPTGMLMQHNMVPFTGELGAGISERGVNQRFLSGMKMCGLETCLSYASEKFFAFNAQNELEKIKKIEKVKNTPWLIPNLHISVLRLLLIQEKTECYEEIKNHISKLIETLPETTDFIAPQFSEYKQLVGEICPIKRKELKEPQELQRGEIVIIQRKDKNNSLTHKYGIFIKKLKNGLYSVISDKDGVIDWINPSYIHCVDDEILDKSKKQASPLTENQKMAIEIRMRNDREKLETILKLFDTVKPLNLDSLDLNLINEPFPLVWGSTSNSLKIKTLRNTAIKGEQIIKMATLGKDIDLVFTNQERVSQLQTILKDHGVQVLSFESAYYILGHDKETKYSS